MTAATLINVPAMLGAQGELGRIIVEVSPYSPHADFIVVRGGVAIQLEIHKAELRQMIKALTAALRPIEQTPIQIHPTTLAGR